MLEKNLSFCFLSFYIYFNSKKIEDQGTFKFIRKYESMTFIVNSLQC